MEVLDFSAARPHTGSLPVSVDYLPPAKGVRSQSIGGAELDEIARSTRFWEERLLKPDSYPDSWKMR